MALTSILIKTLEKLVKSEILKKIEHALDPVQFAYRANRGGEDATVTLLDSVFKRLLLFVDFSSLLIRRLLEQLDLSNNVVRWISNGVRSLIFN